MQLEQMMGYQPIQTQRTQERERTYTTVNLESMSASALYTGDIQTPKVGMNLPGGLTIKDVRKNTITLQEDFGGVGNIYTAHPDGSGATRFYGLGKGKARETKDTWKK